MTSTTEMLKKHGSELKSYINREEASFAQEYRDIERVKKELESGDRYQVVIRLLQRVIADEKKEESRHKKVMHILSDWMGDLDKELKFLEGTQAQQTVAQFKQELEVCENKVKPASHRMLQLFAKIRNILSGIEEALGAYNQAEKELEEILVRLNSFIQTYEAQSNEIQNYKSAGKSVEEHMEDIIQGKGRYFSKMTIKDRQNIVARYVRMQNFILDKKRAKLQNFLQRAPIDNLHFKSGRDLSDIKDPESHVFAGEPRKMLPALLKAGKKPASMADIMRTRVSVYQKLANEGLSNEEIRNHALFKFWWYNFWITGDAVLYGDGKCTFQTGKNEVWDMKNAELSADVSSLSNIEISGCDHLTKEQALHNETWLKFAQGDDALLKAYVEIVFEFISSGMRIYMPKSDTTVEGRLLWLSRLDYNSRAGGNGSLKDEGGRLFGV